MKQWNMNPKDIVYKMVVLGRRLTTHFILDIFWGSSFMFHFCVSCPWALFYILNALCGHEMKCKTETTFHESRRLLLLNVSRESWFLWHETIHPWVRSWCLNEKVVSCRGKAWLHGVPFPRQLTTFSFKHQLLMIMYHYSWVDGYHFVVSVGLLATSRSVLFNEVG